MRIAMMTRWNVPSGQSAHAVPLAHAFLDMGHHLQVFAPQGMDLSIIYQDDESYVNRCYMLDIWGERERDDYFFCADPFLNCDYDVLLVEDASIMPLPELLDIFPQIKRKAKTVLVVHEPELPQDPNWYSCDWDAVVCFDRRYREFLLEAFPADQVSMIPFPCLPMKHGHKMEARKQLGLPPDRKIMFAYGCDTVHYHVDLIPVMENLSRSYPLNFLLLTYHPTHRSAAVESIPESLVVREEMPTTARLYSYLHASDAYIYYGRSSINGVGVSSTVATCLGAGCPVLVPSYCNFFDLSGEEIIGYADLDELEQRLRDAFEGAPQITKALTTAERFVHKHSSHEIAAQFVRLFREFSSNIAQG